MKHYITALCVFVLSILVFNGYPLFSLTAKFNWANVVAAKAWIGASIPIVESTYLDDEIPDGWDAVNWGQALAEFRIDQMLSFEGHNAAFIRKNNESDFSLYSQIFRTPPNAEVICIVAHRGEKAFLQVRAEGIEGQTDVTLPESGSWQTVSLLFVTLPNGGPVTINMGVNLQGEAWFDLVECRVVGNPRSETLLQNGSFEEDGTTVDFVNWWNENRSQANISTQALIRAREILQPTHNFNYLNAIDLLLGQTEIIRTRMQAVEEGCQDIRAQPGVLLGLALMSDPANSPIMQEYLGRLSIELMPQCPQSYAALSQLYNNEHAYVQAARFAHQAALHTPEIPSRGQYLFSEGLLYAAYIGDYKRAASVLQEAQTYTGWEPHPWYYGATQMYLGKALLHLQRCDEARQSFDKVLVCPQCDLWYAEANVELRYLADCIE